MSGLEKDTEIMAGHSYKNIQITGHARAQIGDIHYHGNPLDTDRQCLKDLWPDNPDHEKEGIQSSKGGLLKDSCIWVLKNPEFLRWRGDQQSRLLWVRGDPGKGKTMLLCSIIDELKKSNSEKHNLSFFFCQATNSQYNNATAVLRSLIRQMVNQQPSLIKHVRKEYDNYRDIFKRINAWITVCDIFKNILEDRTLNHIFLIIDALDECTTGLTDLLNLVRQTSATYSNLKWIVSSRNWPSIEDNLNMAAHKSLLSLELNEESISAAVAIYIKHRVKQLAKEKRYNKDTEDDVHCYLSSNANNTFLWVALVCQELARPEVRPHHTRLKLGAFPPGLDQIYQRMMDQISNSEDAILCIRILAIVSVVYWPITLDELMTFIDLPDGFSNNEYLAEIIRLCGSFLTVKGPTILFIHQSAKDFLVGNPSKEMIFPSGIKNEHYTIFSQSLQAMSRILRRDIYNLKVIWNPNSGECQQTFKGHDNLVGSVIFCHDSKLVASASDDRTIRIWDIYSSKCQQTLKDDNNSIHLFTSHNTKFSQARNTSGNEYLQTSESHSGLVFSIHFSYNFKLVASASDDGTVYIWDTQSSQCQQTFKGHSGVIYSAAFSHNSNLITSASYDKTVRVWDTSSGECLQTLEGHSNIVWSVAFSHNSMRIASASCDMTVRIWSTSSGDCLQSVENGSRGPIIPFDTTSSYLLTDIGAIPVPSVSDITAAPRRSPFQGWGISSTRRWITWNSENILWIPPKYRPECSAVAAATVILGCSSGQVLIFNFDSQPLF
ncbi:hypothetical protein MferCBS31731_002294 [Microsporum ferrugineum]